MKLSTILTLATGALAAPFFSRRQASNVTDVDILQFALTLEHLETVFYQSALALFSPADFAAAGLSNSFFTDLQFVAADEQSHVELLSSAISSAGAAPVAPCNYTFPVSDVASFITLSAVLEGVGTSAYLGAAPILQSKSTLSVAASILVTEAIHTSLQRSTKGLIPSPNPLGTPLGANEVFTIAASFITSCPSTNAALPLKAFPSLTVITVAGASYSANEEIVIVTEAALPTQSLFVTFISGLDIVSVAATAAGSTVVVVIPQVAAGQTYIVLTNANVNGTLSDSQVLAGPAIIEVAPGSPSLNDSIH